MNKIILIFFLLVAFSLTSFGQAPNWTWAKSGQGAGHESNTKISVDTHGNVFVIGAYQSDSITFETFTLYNSGGWDIFILKYDSIGNLLWTKNIGNSGDELAYSCETDATGNLIIAGMYNSDSISIDNTTIIDNGITDIFIFKCDSLGNMLWFKGVGSIGNDQGYAVSTDAFGNIYISGWYDSSSISFGTVTLTNQGSGDIFVAKYNESGNIIWAKSAGGVGSELVSASNCDNFGNFYVMGYFNSSTIIFGTDTLTNSGGNKVFIVKYNSNGNIIWARGYGNVGLQPSFDLITSDAFGNTYIAGYFDSSNITFGAFTITNTGNTDIFIVKHDSLGNVLWAKADGNAGYEAAWNITADATGNVYVSGNFNSTSITFGLNTLNNSDISGNTPDIFISKYDTIGNAIWATSIGGTATDYIGGVKIHNLKNIYVSGAFNSPSINFGSNTLTNAGDYDNFVAKYEDATLNVKENSCNFSSLVYPNPFNYFTTIILNKTLKSGHLYVYNLNNQLVMEFNNLTGNKISIYREYLPSGLYYVRISDDNFIQTAKLLITD